MGKGDGKFHFVKDSIRAKLRIMDIIKIAFKAKG